MPVKHYQRIKQDTPHLRYLLRLKLFRAYKAGLFTFDEVIDKLTTIGGLSAPIQATKFIMDMDVADADKTTLSDRERKRRFVITMYNQGRIDESILEQRLKELFIRDGSHEKNQTTITTTHRLHLYIAARSKRYITYLLNEFPTTYRPIFQEEIKQKITTEHKLLARDQRASLVIDRIRNEIESEKSNQS